LSNWHGTPSPDFRAEKIFWEKIGQISFPQLGNQEFGNADNALAQSHGERR